MHILFLFFENCLAYFDIFLYKKGLAGFKNLPDLFHPVERRD